MSHKTTTKWTPDAGRLLLVMALAPHEVGQRIKHARERKGWTQLEFALTANVSPSSVARWEAGKLPPVRELFRIAELLGVDVDGLVENSQLEGHREELEAKVDRGFEAVTTILERLEQRLVELEAQLDAVPKVRAE